MVTSYKGTTKIMTLTVGVTSTSFSLTINNPLDVVYRENRSASFLNPSRLAVPKYVHHVCQDLFLHFISRYQNHFRITVWFFFLVAYSIAGAYRSH